jgi:GNAT superfamily N-acetyltransferase
MPIIARVASNEDALPFRARQREETGGQIVHDSIHRRAGWTVTHLIEVDGVAAGFGSIAVAGPWTGRPTVFEFYLLPELRCRGFTAFEAYLAASGAKHFEVQTNEVLLMVMLHAFGRDVWSERIVFRDHHTTDLRVDGAVLRAQTDPAEVHAAIERRQGGGEWVLELGGKPVGKGGLLFHYNRPYGDVYMEVDEAHRRRGLGVFLVQALKRECYALGAIPAARCDTRNVASRRTLVRAGFAPWAHILIADVTDSAPVRFPDSG